MGSFLADIEDKQISIDQQLLNSSYSKLVEYYSSYKSICQGYTISIPQYTHIFGPNQLSFQAWEGKQRGRIDAIQMFTGLIIFSSIGFQQKIKFLFEMFDFNEEGFLYYQNVALMLVNACNATYKVYSIPKTTLYESIETFLDQYFTQESQISFEKLLKWTNKVSQLGKYFRLIGHEVDQIQEQRHIISLATAQCQQLLNQSKKVYFHQNSFELDHKFLKQLEGTFEKSSADENGQILNLGLDWIFGINIGRQRIKYICSKGMKAANQRIIYSAGRVIIIYLPKLNAQYYYKEHTQSISIIEISTDNRLVASAEDGQQPQLHIWDLKNRAALIKFKKIHKQGIQYIKFLKNDKQLIATSRNFIQGSSPIIILNLQTQQIVMSTYLQYPLLGVAFSEELLTRYQGLLVVGTKQLAFFSQQKDSYQVYSQKIKIKEPIRAFSYDKIGNLLTAHSGRKLYYWDQKIQAHFIDYTSSNQQIEEIFWLQDKLCLLDSVDIELLWFEEGMKIVKSFSLDIRKTGLFNGKLFHMEATGIDEILLLTTMGDVVKVSELNHFQKPNFYKYYSFFRVIEPRDYLMEENGKLLLLGGSLLYVIDKYQKELYNLWKYEWQLERIISGKNCLLLQGKVDEKTKILVSINPKDYKIKQSFKVSCRIGAMVLLNNFFLFFSENTLTIFHQQDDKFFQKKPTVHTHQFGSPRVVANSFDPQVFVLFNEFQDIIRVNFSGMNQVDIRKIQSKSQYSFFNRVSGVYTSAHHEYAFCGCLDQKIFAVSQNNGVVLLWNSINQAINQQNSAINLSFHTGKIAQLVLSEKQMVSLGEQDGIVVLMKHRSYKQIADNEPFIDDFSKSQNMNLTQSYGDGQEIHKQTTINISGVGGTYLKESEVELAPLNEIEQSTLKYMIREIINPTNKTVYEPLIKEETSFGATKVNLQMERINGFSSNIPHALYYRHIYSQQPAQLIHYPSQGQHQEGVYIEDFRFTRNILLPIDDIHLGCAKQLLYAADRFCILRDGKDNKQRIYEYHRRRVTCLAIHPDRQLVASCEESNKYPSIHLWDAQQLSNKATISTRHIYIITRIAFSRDGEWLVTLGGPEGRQSVQVTSWRDEEEILFRLLQGFIFRQVLFNPYERNQISIVGQNIIQVLRNEGGMLVFGDECKVDHDITTITYTSSIYGNAIESDLVVGTALGSIGIFICGKFILSKEEAHSSSITCIRLAQLFGYKRVLISGGNDGIVKIWDIKFHELSTKNIRSQIYSFKLSNDDRPQCKITSLDIYQCLKNHNTSKPSTLLLIGCSDGSVLEATIHNESQGNYIKSHTTQETQKLKEKINFDITLLFSAPPNMPQTKFQIYRNFMLTFNISSLYLQIWNITTWEKSFIYGLPQFPCLICCMNNRPAFVVAYKEGTSDYMSILELVFQNNILRSVQSINLIQNTKGLGEPLLAAFSSKDDRLAMIFANQQGNFLYFFISDQTKIGFALRCKVDVGGSTSFLDFSSNGQAIIIGMIAKTQEYQIKCYKYHYIQKQKEKQKQSDKHKLEQIADFSKFDFRSINFAKKIKANYVDCNYFLHPNQEPVTKLSIKITSMAQYDRYLILGTINGELLIVQSSFFIKKSTQPKIKVRNYVLTDSSITNLIVKDDFLIASSQRGQGIIKAQLKLEQSWEFQQINNDRYNQYLTADKLKDRLNKVYDKRRKMQTEQQVDSTGKGVHLKLSAVIGRNAVLKRNNIFVDLKDSIISFSGCNILIMKRYPQKRLEQIRVKPDPTPTSIHPEISTMALGDCKRLLVIGTAEQQSKLLVWNISTHTYLFRIPLPGFVSVSIIKLSLTSKHAAIVALTEKNNKRLLFADLQNRTIIGVFKLLPHQIVLNDICFAQAEQYRILGCGPNYMGEWTFNNGILNAKRYSLGDHQDLQDLKKSGIIFYSLIFVQGMAISSGSDGYLYIWKQGQLAKRQNAHPGHEVLSLYAATNSKIFASGGTNGRVVIWKVWSSLIIQHQGEYPSKQGNLKFPIQAISMTRQSLVVGDTSGAIMEFGFESQDLNGFETLLAPFDHEEINSCAFSTSSKRLYVLTDAKQWGTFAIFDTYSFQKIREQRIDFKGSSLIRMLVCRLSNKIFFVMKNYISGNVLQSQSKDERSKIIKSKWFFKCNAGIKTAALSSRQNYLAVLVMQSSQHNSRIQIYNLEVIDGQFYAQYNIQDNIPASIDLIDFCVDHDYLLYQGPDQEQTIIDLMSKQKIKITSIESQLEWNQQAKKTSPAMADIISTFADQNKLLRLVQVMNKCLIATDQIGSIRVFRQPFVGKGIPSQVCIQHLNEVYICVVSPDSKLLVTVSRQDRAMHFWELVDE